MRGVHCSLSSQSLSHAMVPVVSHATCWACCGGGCRRWLPTQQRLTHVPVGLRCKPARWCPSASPAGTRPILSYHFTPPAPIDHHFAACLRLPPSLPLVRAPVQSGRPAGGRRQAELAARQLPFADRVWRVHSHYIDAAICLFANNYMRHAIFPKIPSALPFLHALVKPISVSFHTLKDRSAAPRTTRRNGARSSGVQDPAGEQRAL